MGERLPAPDLGNGRSVRAVSAGQDFTCALLDDRSVKCWGGSLSGQLGLGDTQPRGDQPNEMGNQLPAIDFGSGHAVLSVATGIFSSCAVLVGGSIKCWGENIVGELGLGDFDDRGDQPNEMGDQLPAVSLGRGETARAVGVSRSFACALLVSGSVKCWGNNEHGELGLGDTRNRGAHPGEMGDALPSVPLGTGRTAQAIAVGEGHACALLDDGSVKCWGSNVGGILGLGVSGNPRGDQPGEMGDALPVVNLGTTAPVVSLATKGYFNCALFEDGSVKCWGGNYYGELGLGDSASRGTRPEDMGDRLPRVDLGTGRTAKGICTGVEHTCALLDDGHVKCWGENGSGQLGLGDLGLGTLHARGDQPNQMGDNLPNVDVTF